MSLVDTIRRALVPYETPVIQAVEVPARRRPPSVPGRGSWRTTSRSPTGGATRRGS